FYNLIRDIVEVYVDDIVVKTKVGSTLVEDISLVFDRLRATRTKLNPEKCIFGVPARKLLGFLVSHRGIEANPAKIKAIEVMRPPGRIKDVQTLTRSLAALSRFISRLAERALPFFKLLTRTGPFSWTEEAEQAFQELKQHLTSLPVLVAPETGETLFLYLAASAEAVSMVLVAERTEQARQGDTRVYPAKDGEPDHGHGGPATTPLSEGPDPGQRGPEEPRPSGNPEPLGAQGPDVVDKGETDPVPRVQTIQKPVYYVSEVLHEANARYLEKHKFIYAILIVSRKLRHYFQAHRVVVVTSYPLRAILHNSNAMGNIAKWAAELAEFQLDFQPRHAIKSQILADFIAEWTPSTSNSGVRTLTPDPQSRKSGHQSSPSPIGQSSLTAL